MKSLKRILVALIIVSMMAPFAVFAEEVSPADAAKLLTYETILDGEVSFAITKDIDLSAVAEKIGASVTWESSDESVITDEGVITRDNYRNGTATLTATIGTGSDAVTKTFDFTVLADAIHTYYADTFYYPGYEGQLITDATSAWQFTRKTTLDGDGMITTIQKDDTDEVNYYTKGGRTGYTEKVHYTRLPLGKQLGQLTWEADIMFDSDEGTRQLYFIELYGKYQVGQYVETAQIVDFRNDFFADGTMSNYTRYKAVVDGEDKTPTKSGKADVIKEETWARVRIDLDTNTQTYDIYINGEPFIMDTPFFERDQLNRNRTEFIGVAYMQYGPFRTYTSGNAMCFDNMSFRDNNRHYDENADAYELADMMDFSLLSDENADSVTGNLDLSLSTLQSYINSKDITVTWESSDVSALSISGNTATPYREKLPKEVTLTANINQTGKTYTVEKSFDVTVMPSDDYLKVYNVYRYLTEETFTTQPADSISSDLDFSDAHIEKYASLDGVTVEFTSSDENVISSSGVVTRGEGNKDCEITVTVTDNASGNSMTRSLNYTVLDKSQYVYYSTNFAYPDQVAAEVPSVDGWTLHGEKFKSTIEQDGENYLLKSARGDTGSSGANHNYLTFDRARGNVSIKMDVKFEHNENPGKYQFFIDGKYMDGTSLKSMSCGEISFEYDLSSAYIRIKDKTFSTLYTLPRIGQWMELEFRMDVLTQTYDIYINGEKYNLHSIPFYNANNTETEGMNDCVGITGIHYSSFRQSINTAIYTDNVVVTGERYLQSNCEIHENGERLTELKFVNNFDECEYDLVTKIVNDTGVDKEFDLYVGVYDDGRLVSVKKNPGITLADGEFTTETFEGITIPKDLEKVEIKVFKINEELVPVDVNAYIPSNILSDYQAEEYYFEDTGRTMTYVDLHGSIAYKPYFNAQCWSADSRKLYFQGKDHSVYEYSTVDDTIRFIGEGYGNFGLVTTPQNKLIYSSKNGRIIEMDCDTYEKRIAGELPEGQTNGGSLLTVSNDGKYLSMTWTDTMGGMENDDTLKNRRFPILNMETGEWNTEHYFGFEDAPPYNTGMNPAYPNLLLFNHCATEGDTLDRNWVIDTNTGIATNRFKQKDYTSTLTGEVISHETWSYDGELLYIDKGRSSKFGMSGVMSFDKDGNNRRHINDDYSYLHLGVNPVNPRFIVSDTGYGNAEATSDIVVVDCHSGKSYKLATTNQTGDDSIAHSHPIFTPDGMKVCFGVYNGDFTSAGIGIIDVTDIVTQNDYMEIVELSDTCNAESYLGMNHEIKLTEKDGTAGYNIVNGNYMRVNYKGAEQSNVKADIEITYFADGGQGELGYFIWVEDPETHNSLDEYTYVFDKLNTGKWETITISFDDINLENMGHMGSDFYLKGVDSDMAIRSVKVTQK